MGTIHYKALEGNLSSISLNHSYINTPSNFQIFRKAPVNKLLKTKTKGILTTAKKSQVNKAVKPHEFC